MMIIQNSEKLGRVAMETWKSWIADFERGGGLYDKGQKILSLGHLAI